MEDPTRGYTEAGGESVAIKKRWAVVRQTVYEAR